MKDLVIRHVTLADRTQLLAFHRALYITYRDQIVDRELIPLYAYHDFESVLRDDVDALLRNKEVVVLMAESDARAVGYITGRVENEPRRVLSRRGVIEDWFVDEDARGSGIGRRLYESLVEVFRRRGCAVVESATWPFNAAGRRAHEALGFHEVEVKYRRRL